MTGAAYLSTPGKGSVSHPKRPFRAALGILPALLFAALTAFSGLLGGVANAAPDDGSEFNPGRWLMCEWGSGTELPILYQAANSSDIQFSLFSKSSVSAGTEDVNGGLNWLLAVTGMKFDDVNTSILGYKTGSLDGTQVSAEEAENLKFNGGKQVTPFERFGVAGLNFTAYSGEWKHVVLQACSPSAGAQDPQTNYYYADRLPPRSTWEMRGSSDDVRTIQHGRGILTQIGVSFINTSANLMFLVTKTIVALTLAFINIAFLDITSLLGLHDFLAGEDGGVFKRLYDGLFMPLIVIAFAATGASVFWRGIARRQYRTALGTVGRSVGVFFAAAIIAANSLWFVALPNNVVIFLQSAVVSALGTSLTGGSGLCTIDNAKAKSTQLTADSDNSAIAAADAEESKDKSQGLLASVSQNVRSAIGCSIWQQFLVKPWAQGQFGADWNQTWAKGQIPSWADAKTASAFANGDQNAKMTGNAEVPMGNGTFINNWALFHISTMTNVHAPVGEEAKRSAYTSGVANDWWRIVDVLANYEEEGGKFSEDADKGDSVAPAPVTQGSGKVATVPPVNLKPWTLQLGEAVAKAYGDKILSIGGWRQDQYEDHPSGEALDFMFSELGKMPTEEQKAAGDSLAQCLADNAKQIGLKSVIWAGKIYSTRDGGQQKPLSEWRTYGGYGGASNQNVTTGHYDHVHVRVADGTELPACAPGTQKTVSTEYYVPKDNPVLASWDTWTGNSSSERILAAGSSVVVAAAGLAAPAVFSFLTAVYSLGTTIVMVFAPLALLAGAWGDRGWSITKSWGALVLGLMTKRLITGGLLVVSMLMTAAAIKIAGNANWVQGVTLMVLVSVILLKSRKMIMSSVTGARFAAVNFLQGADRVGGAASGTSKGFVKMSAMGLAGGLAAKRHGGSFAKGAKTGISQEIKTIGYKSDLLRRSREEFVQAKADRLRGPQKGIMHSPYARGGESGYENPDYLLCSQCFARLDGESRAYLNKYGSYVCDECASDAGDTAEFIEVPVRTQAERTEELAPPPVPMKTNFTRRVLTDAAGAMSSGKLTPADKKKQLDKMISATAREIADAQDAAELGQKAAAPEIPAHLRRYVDVNVVEEAWENRQFEFLGTLYSAAWTNWYIDGVREQLTADIRERAARDGSLHLLDDPSALADALEAEYAELFGMKGGWDAKAVIEDQAYELNLKVTELRESEG